MNFLKKASLFFSCFALCMLTASCGIFGWSMPEQIAQSEPDKMNDYGMKKNMPLTFAVYPFKNLTKDECAAYRARRAVQSEFSLIGECKSLASVDKYVSKKIYTVTDAVKVGRELGVDAVVFGEVTKQSHYWHIFTAYTSVNVKLWVYSTQTGKCIWQGENGSTDFNLGLPNFISPTLDNIKWTRHVEELYHRNTADMVHSIKPTVYYTRTKQIPPASLNIE